MAKAVTYQILNALNNFVSDLIKSESFKNGQIQRKINRLKNVARNCTYYDNPCDDAIKSLRDEIAEKLALLAQVATEQNDEACYNATVKFGLLLANDDEIVALCGKKSDYDVYSDALDLNDQFMNRIASL